jgi:uncharacterized protein (DUF2267 family)
MSVTGLNVFDDTVQKTNIWLKDVMDDLGPDRQRAYQVLRAVLHTLRDRLTIDEGAHLSAQLPMLIRGIFYEGWDPQPRPNKARSLDEFMAEVSQRLDAAPPINPETATRAVFRAIDRHVTAGETQDVRTALPKEVQALWR